MKVSTIVVLVLALLLGAYVYFYEMKHGKSREDEESSKPAFTFKSDDVKAINLIFKGQSVTLEKTDKNWVISKPSS